MRGRVTAMGNTTILIAGKEIEGVPIDRVEAFSNRKR
jgi:hypothetical protein